MALLFGQLVAARPLRRMSETAQAGFPAQHNGTGRLKSRDIVVNSDTHSIKLAHIQPTRFPRSSYSITRTQRKTVFVQVAPIAQSWVSCMYIHLIIVRYNSSRTAGQLNSIPSPIQQREKMTDKQEAEKKAPFLVIY